MSDQELHNKVRNAFRAASMHAPPDFDEVWEAAKARHRKSRRQYAIFGSVAAAAAVAAIAIGGISVQTPEVDDDYLIADALLNSTQWSAPSDALMPQHQFDIYREIPFQIESTDMQEGSLL